MADGDTPAQTPKPGRGPLDETALRVADAVGALMEGWGFKRNMGRLWTVLYLENRPVSAAEIGDLLQLSSGAVSMLLTELQQWGAVKKAWVPGERREYYEPETSIWKMVSRVFRERELRWIREALESFESAQAQLAASTAQGGSPAQSGTEPDDRTRLVVERVAGLTELARVGAHLLETMLEGSSVDALPIKTVGELAQAARRSRGE
jgi:HTH-type transcriptional regulator, glycine betaine synthesis regulator